MTGFMKALTAVLLAVSLTTAVHGVNTCLASRCVPGTSVVSFSGCSITDAEHAQLAECFTTIGRATITIVYLSYNQLVTVPSDLFEGMSSVTHLIFYNAGLTSLPAAAFQPVASTLQTLMVSSNALETLPSGLLDGMGNLNSLSFDVNPMTTLPTGIFDDLTGVTLLNAGNLELTTLPSGLFANMGSLTEIDLADGMLTALDVDVFDGLSSADFLDLRNNALTTLPKGVFETAGSGTSLRWLLLAGNTDLQCVPTSIATGERAGSSSAASNTYSDPVANAGLCECSGVATCDSDLTCNAGADGFTCDAAVTVCAVDSDCDTGAGEECCLTKLVCEVPDAAGACGDPHMTGFHGQKFDFTGEDGKWYAVVSDLPYMHLNMRVTAPVPSLPEITYITGISIITTDTDGLYHTIVISVRDPHSMDSVCPVGMSSCLADGALHVVANGEEIMLTPDEVTLAPGVAIAAVNLPGECRSFGFEQYWEKKKLQLAQPGRRLSEGLMEDMSDWVLADPTATNMPECEEYVATAAHGAGLFEHQSEHASFQIMTPTATIRLSHGRLHQLSMRDPTDQYDLPDHLAWQMNLAIDRSAMSLDATGILGETMVPTLDQTGAPIMQGMSAIRGEQEDYRVSGPLEVFFSQDQQHHAH